MLLLVIKRKSRQKIWTGIDFVNMIIKIKLSINSYKNVLFNNCRICILFKNTWNVCKIDQRNPQIFE